MSTLDHIDSLRAKHARLDRQIDEELHRPLPDQSTVTRLKREKLRLKEQMTHFDGVIHQATAAAPMHAN